MKKMTYNQAVEYLAGNDATFKDAETPVELMGNIPTDLIAAIYGKPMEQVARDLWTAAHQPEVS
jgi:hypothetical protein